jgi:hypothetical protein
MVAAPKMDGKEKELSATREGIGDTRRPEKVGLAGETPKGANKRTIASLVTPNERNLAMSTKAVENEERAADFQKKEIEEAERSDNKNTSMSTMMKRMNAGKAPDETSVEDSMENETARTTKL